jgi:hypothetical protein
MKKKKASKDIFNTQCWAYEIISDPYQVFTQCFCFADIRSYRETICNTLVSAGKSKVYNKEEPAFLLSKFNAINSVIVAAHDINLQKKSGALKFELKDFAEQRLYAKPFSCCPEWEYLPKTLTDSEYQNPYKVFRKFFRHEGIEDWLQTTNLVLDYALASYKEGCDLNLLQLYFQLTSLLEAAHLIDVREVTHIGGRLKFGLQIAKSS